METAELVRQLEKQFSLDISSVDVVKQVPRHHLYKLQSGRGNVFLKLWLDSAFRERVVEEAALLDYLNHGGFKAPVLVKDVSGGSVADVTISNVSMRGYLTEEIEIERSGIDTEDETHLRMAARSLAEFHSLCSELRKDFTAVSWNLHWLIDRNLRTIESSFVERRSTFDEITRAFERVRAHLVETWEKTEPEFGIIHGDLHAANVALAADGELWFLDFESFGNGWRIQDIVYLLGDAVDEKDPCDLPVLRRRYEIFMNEYVKAGPHLADAPELPVAWLAVRQLLQLGRRVRAIEESGVVPSSGDSTIDAFAEMVLTLARQGVLHGV